MPDEDGVPDEVYEPVDADLVTRPDSEAVQDRIGRPLKDIGKGLHSLAIILESTDGEPPYPGFQYHIERDDDGDITGFKPYTCEFEFADGDDRAEGGEEGA